MRNPRLRFCALILAIAPALLGCGQKTDGWFGQKSDQAANTSTDQDTATQGSQVYPVFNLAFNNGPQTPLAGEDGDSQTFPPASAEAASVGGLASADGSKLATADGKFVQVIWFSHPITTGGTAPSVTGSSTGSAAQTPSQTSTQSPTQHVDPRLSTSVPIAVAQPGSMIDQQATAATEGSTASPTKTSENDLRYAEIKATADKLEAMLPLLEKLLGAPSLPADTQPAVGPPVETTGE